MPTFSKSTTTKYLPSAGCFPLPVPTRRSAAPLLAEYGLRYLIFTAGENYSVIYSPQARSYLPTPKVEVVDTVSAGDAFSGAFVYGILTGKTMEQAHRDAVRISAFVCTRPGAWPAYTLDLKG